MGGGTSTGGDMAPARPEGATFHECEACGGSGEVDDGEGDDIDCPECDGTGEWFE